MQRANSGQHINHATVIVDTANCCSFHLLVIDLFCFDCSINNYKITMAPKKIIVVDASGSHSKEKLSSQYEYDKLLGRLGVAFLVTDDGFNMNGFESLANGNTYTLGQPEQQQPPAQVQVEQLKTELNKKPRWSN